ncbi:TetR/AcrR family transcriptional regulator [Nocardia sp. BMG111209]|uniref:TetR/AcrR family transcriptional regulator n=1 Tax=Nocardia sp. BMG111209 TaxID=1160137 RepID=UPI00037E528D|nr:TetR/AcrR family transcriptional regulator [Nocardia sp. BMG111209]
MPSPESRALRSDARRNRELVLRAAGEMFAEHGVDVAMADIARHAGVSNGTLYNRFPTRQDLIDAVFLDRLETLAVLADQAAAEPDPWQGVVTYVTGMCELQAEDRGFNEVAARGLRSDAARELQVRGASALGELFTRAKAAGELRPDLTLGDLAFVVWGISRTVEMTRETAPHAWRRHLALYLDGMRAAGARPLPDRPPGAHES